MVKYFLALLAALAFTASAADLRPSYPSMEDPTTSAGVPLHHVVEGDPVSGKNVNGTMVGKDVAGNFTFLKTDLTGGLVTTALTGFGADFSFGDITSASLTQKIVQRTVYTEQTTNAQRSIASANANDTAAGTGARTVKIDYFDATGAGPFSETVTLNGTTYVNTVATNICFIEEIRVLTAGSGLVNAGILTLKAATAGGGATIGTINATDNQTFWSHHYVATGKEMNITGVAVSHSGTTVGSGGVFVVKSTQIAANAAIQQVTDFIRLYGQSSTFSRTYSSPVKVTGPAKVFLYVTPETSSSMVYRGSVDFFQP
jgi:hypothetical protein